MKVSELVEINYDDLRIQLVAMTELAKSQEKELKRMEEKYSKSSDEAYWLITRCLEKDKNWIIQAVKNSTDLEESTKEDLLQFFKESFDD